MTRLILRRAAAYAAMQLVVAAGETWLLWLAFLALAGGVR